MSEWATNIEMLFGDVVLGLSSYPNDWLNGGIEPATPGFAVYRVTVRQRNRSKNKIILLQNKN